MNLKSYVMPEYPLKFPVPNSDGWFVDIIPLYAPWNEKKYKICLHDLSEIVPLIYIAVLRQKY